MSTHARPKLTAAPESIVSAGQQAPPAMPTQKQPVESHAKTREAPAPGNPVHTAMRRVVAVEALRYAAAAEKTNARAGDLLAVLDHAEQNGLSVDDLREIVLEAVPGMAYMTKALQDRLLT